MINIDEINPYTYRKQKMNWLTYIKNMIKSHSTLVSQNEELSELVSDTHIDYFLKHSVLNEKISSLEKEIESLREQNKMNIQNVLIHANEKRSLINLLNKTREPV